MADFGNVLMLLAAIVTCMAVGVLLAYAACNALFAAMRPRGVMARASDVQARQTA